MYRDSQNFLLTSFNQIQLKFGFGVDFGNLISKVDKTSGFNKKHIIQLFFGQAQSQQMVIKATKKVYI